MNARVLILLLLAAAPARAAPYLVAYEADTPGVYPEDVGWQRLPTGGGAVRTVADGLLTLDGFASTQITDQYLFDMAEQMDPDPGEFFFAEWRMRLLPGSDSSDVGVFIAPDAMCERSIACTQRRCTSVPAMHGVSNSTPPSSTPTAWSRWT